MDDGRGEDMKTNNGITACLALVFVLLAAPVAGHAADTGSVRVMAVIRAFTECTVSTGDMDLDFSPPGVESPVGAGRNTSVTYRCAGSGGAMRLKVTDDSGLHGTKGDVKRLRNSKAPEEYIPYRLLLSPVSVPAPGGVSQTLTISGILLGRDYRGAYPGGYRDTVTVTIVP
jgi:hypothetical protein